MIEERILIIVPHPDDEVLLSAGVIRRALKENKKIWVAIVTNGDYLATDHKKGSRRLAESLDALTFLGMKEEYIFFLGYPDTGMEEQVSFISTLKKEEDPQKVHPSTISDHTYGITNGKMDFHREKTGEQARYTRENFEWDIQTLIEQTKPSLVITTSYFDIHGDHSGLSWFVRKIVEQAKCDMRPKIWEGMVHSPAGDLHWPQAGGKRSLYTMPSNFRKTTNLVWEDRIRIPLLKDDIEKSVKFQAIQRYPSVLSPEEPEVVAYLLSFAKGEEIFFEI